MQLECKLIQQLQAQHSRLPREIPTVNGLRPGVLEKAGSGSVGLGLYQDRPKSWKLGTNPQHGFCKKVRVMGRAWDTGVYGLRYGVTLMIYLRRNKG